MAQSSQLFTAEDLAQIPDDDFRYELVRGRLVKMSPPGFRHGRIAVSLATLLRAHARGTDLGEVVAEAGFKLATNPDTVRGPDVAFVRRERLDPGGGPIGFFDGAPDLAVEIVSPDNTRSELVAAVRDYLDAGARLVWVADPEHRTVTVHRPMASPVVLGADDRLEGADVVPGFSCRVGQLFE